jgi:hypothetical protein
MAQIILIGALITALIAGAAYGLDKFRAYIVAEVHGEYRAEAERRNVKLRAVNTEAEIAGATLDAALEKAAADAAKVPGNFPMTAEQATALNAIRKAR